MKPLGFLVGALAGVAATLLVTRRGGGAGIRPAAKSALKAALLVWHEARVKGAELVEAAEDLYAEARGEVTEEIIAAAMTASAAAAATAGPETTAAPGTAAADAGGTPGRNDAPRQPRQDG